MKHKNMFFLIICLTTYNTSHGSSVATRFRLAQVASPHYLETLTPYLYRIIKKHDPLIAAYLNLKRDKEVLKMHSEKLVEAKSPEDVKFWRKNIELACNRLKETEESFKQTQKLPASEEIISFIEERIDDIEDNLKSGMISAYEVNSQLEELEHEIEIRSVRLEEILNIMKNLRKKVNRCIGKGIL